MEIIIKNLEDIDLFKNFDWEIGMEVYHYKMNREWETL